VHLVHGPRVTIQRMDRVQINLRVSPEELEQIEAERGEVPREEFIRAILRERVAAWTLVREGLSPEEDEALGVIPREEFMQHLITEGLEARRRRGESPSTDRQDTHPEAES
jgi:hypothetical protein